VAELAAVPAEGDPPPARGSVHGAGRDRGRGQKRFALFPGLLGGGANADWRGYPGHGSGIDDWWPGVGQGAAAPRAVRRNRRPRCRGRARLAKTGWETRRRWRYLQILLPKEESGDNAIVGVLPHPFSLAAQELHGGEV